MDSVTGADAAGNIPTEPGLKHVAFEGRLLRQDPVLGNVSQFVCNQLFKIIVN